MKKPWKRICVNLSQEEYDVLRTVASVKKQSVAAFMRYILNIHVRNSAELIKLINEVRGISEND